jgi:hypothetical protein
MAQQTVISRRSFLKSSALAGGGLLISFCWMNGSAFKGEGALASTDELAVQNDFDPTGMGEPGFPPVFAALANGLYKATGKRFYDQPFVEGL